jgi:hypothetical protein
MRYPKTPEEWWSLVDKEWDNLLGIMQRYITVPSEEITKAKEQKQHTKLIKYFNDAWFNAPDAIRIHTIPGWYALCDLCSEAHNVF